MAGHGTENFQRSAIFNHAVRNYNLKENLCVKTGRKEISFWNLPKRKALSAEIAELKSEKAVLLSQLDCADEAGMVLRSEKPADASDRIQSVYGEKYASLLMFDSQRDVSELLHQDAENHAYRKKQKKHKNAWVYRSGERMLNLGPLIFVSGPYLLLVTFSQLAAKSHSSCSPTRQGLHQIQQKSSG